MKMTQEQAKALIDERYRVGRLFVDAGREQGSWEGIEWLFSDELYPDQSHFLYELLQNAEDAGATKIHFELEAERLKVIHNGKRLFDEKDLRGITTIGRSQKRDDVNTIGKFGVGFKSVFAYTQAPVICSGVVSFCIRDLIVPNWIEPNLEIDPFETAFIIEFDQPGKSQIQCFKEIAAGLDNLPASTILFLRSLNEISWTVAGNRNGIIRKDDANDVLPTRDGLSQALRINCRTSDGEEDNTLWLRFEAPLKERSDLCCSMAFLLDVTSGKEAESEQDELPGSETKSDSIAIRPLSEPGLLHIYFPAGKEPTGLLFHIHAPFAATVDRASIPFEHEGNQSLMVQLAELSRTALKTIKELGLLRPAFLGVLPNLRDDLHEFYSPVRESIVAAFQEEELLPTHHGGFAKAKEVIYGPRELRMFFSDEDLKTIVENPAVAWCPGFKMSSRPDFFLDTLNVEAIDWAEFVGSWDKVMGGENTDDSSQIRRDLWIRDMMSRSGNSIDWIKGLYRLLLKADKEIKPHPWSNTDKRLKRSPVVLTEEEALKSGEGVYLARGTQTIPGVSVEVVHPDLLKIDPRASQDKEKEIRAALTMFGVVEFDEQAAITAFVKKIGSQKTIPIADHLEQMRCLLAWYKEGTIDDLSELETASLFIDKSGGFYRRPGSFYLDSPFKNTGLSIFYEGENDTYSLWPKYAEEFDVDEFTKFAEEVGVRVDLPIVKIVVNWSHPEAQRMLGGWGATRRTRTETDVDWKIEGLEGILARHNAEANRELWNRLCQLPSHHFYCRYSPNESHTARSGYSTFVHLLREIKWVQTKDGAFESPGKLDANQIARGWSLDASNGWLQVSGFGSHAERDAEVQRERTEAAERLGVTPELVELLRSMSFEQQQEWLRRMQDPPDHGEFPEDEDVNVERRTQKAEQQAKESENVNRETRTRSVRTSGDRQAVRVYLAERYSRDGHLYCQMSHQPMPFRLPDGRPYFEAVEIFQLDNEIEANHLCLSPTCAAEFRHALGDSEESLRQRILEVDVESGGLEVTVKVPLNEHSVIRFTKRHLIDLKAALNMELLDEDNEEEGE